LIFYLVNSSTHAIGRAAVALKLTPENISAVIYTTWYIWKERGRRIFEDHHVPETQVFSLIKSDLQLARISYIEDILMDGVFLTQDPAFSSVPRTLLALFQFLSL
jgi:hypothetical protein